MNDVQWEKFIADSLSLAGKKIEPPRELLTSIIAKAKISDKEIIESRFSFDFFNNRKTFFAAGMAFILLAVFFSLPANLKSIHQSDNISPASFAESAAKPAANIADQDINNNQPLTSDDVEAAATAILASISDEDATLASNVDDQSVVEEDGSAVDNLMQSYDQEQL